MIDGVERVVVVVQHVVVDVRHVLLKRRRLPVRTHGQVRLPVPRVDGAVVARLSHRVEYDIAGQCVVAIEAVVDVDGGARHVEHEVAVDGG